MSPEYLPQVENGMIFTVVGGGALDSFRAFVNGGPDWAVMCATPNFVRWLCWR